MTENFTFSNADYNFWSIYESIKKYYPLGIDKEYPGIFFDYWGIKKLEDIIVAKVHDDKNFRLEWEECWEKFSDEIKLPIIGTTYGQAPSFSSYIELKNEKGETCDYVEELHFAVSFVGPFYTIIGQSSTVVNHQEGTDQFHYSAINRITISPDSQTQKYFDFLSEKIESKYNGYKFVPYSINKQTLEGLRVRYRDEKVNRIYHALFNDCVHFPDYGKYDPLIMGDEFYRYDDWAR
jgi:hypothetical protein